ncbi:MAG: GntR family transcriptional regulator [Candidatus Eremiobacteraeota bacterium]|nr:GntR family transcriptional regulator [Candidatus Eremiobacteraeota bacterium]MBV9407478.1 GntR family transcriptional regulator [Candidatus Eremiobacteraeota bacterium]
MAGLALAAIRSDVSISVQVYEAIRAAITATNLYEIDESDLRLDERELAARLGVSRTPIREALVRLEHEGLVTSVPRRGYYIARKSKAELIEIIIVWAALESMAARLVAQRASDAAIASLREIFATFDGEKLAAHIDEYSDANLRFHARIIELSSCDVLRRTADGILIHVRSIRHRTIGEDHRFERSIVDHMHIIEALEARDEELAARLVRDHALALAAHVDANDNDL